MNSVAVASLSGYQLNVLVIVMIYVILAVGLQITVGYAGQISLGHAAFAAIGGYAVALLTTQAEWGSLSSVIAAIAMSAVAGAFLGLTSLRVRHDFLAIVTLGFGIIVQSLANRLEFTGAALGISGVTRPSVFGDPISREHFAILVCIVMLVAIVVAWGLSRSRLGLAWRAVRDDDLVAGTMGLHVWGLKLSAFSIGSAYGGLGGALLAFHLGFVGSDTFSLDMSVTVLAMIVVGGLGSLTGAVVGGVILAALPEFLREVATYRLMIYGALLVLVVVFRPTGLFGGPALVPGAAGRLHSLAARLGFGSKAEVSSQAPTEETAGGQ